MHAMEHEERKGLTEYKCVILDLERKWVCVM